MNGRPVPSCRAKEHYPLLQVQLALSAQEVQPAALSAAPSLQVQLALSAQEVQPAALSAAPSLQVQLALSAQEVQPAALSFVPQELPLVFAASASPPVGAGCDSTFVSTGAASPRSAAPEQATKNVAMMHIAIPI